MKALISIFFSFMIVCSCTPKKKYHQNRNIKHTDADEIINPTFDYQSQKPINGKLNAVIELGSLGLNYFIINLDDQKRWELKKSIYGKSNLIYRESVITKIVSEIVRLKDEIIAYGVDPSDIYTVASSSASGIMDISSLQEKLKPHNLQVKSATAKQEANYALLATIPPEFIEESFMVDIGSGNSKLAWVQSSDTLSITVQGSKYYLNDVTDTSVFRQVRDALLQIPEKNRNLCFMLGGMVYDFVKDDLKGDSEKYITLLPPQSYASNDTEKSKAANIIYTALYLEPTYSYIFDRESNFSIGYLLANVRK